MHVSEIKVRIADTAAVEARLVVVGAAFVSQRSLLETYYKQNPVRVLKVSEDGERAQIIRLRRTPETFVIESRDDAHPDAKELLESQYGVQRILRKARKTFAYKDHTIHLDAIEELGTFLVVEGEQHGRILADLNLAGAPIVRTPYSELSAARPAP